MTIAKPAYVKACIDAFHVKWPLHILTVEWSPKDKRYRHTLIMSRALDPDLVDAMGLFCEAFCKGWQAAVTGGAK